MEISESSLEELKAALCNAGGPIVILSHTNPDGDAVGSSLAWAEALTATGSEHVTCVIPNRYPSFLGWMPGIEKVRVFKDDPQGVGKLVEEAAILFCLDFNQVDRLETLSECISKNTAAKKILIDHHLDPPNSFDVSFSHPESCSTAFLIYTLIKKMWGTSVITTDMATNLYVGIMTDTGSFSYGNLTSGVFSAVETLVERGIDIPAISRNIYNSFTADRVRLLGFALNKMETVESNNGKAAWITLTEKELRRYCFQPGDSEGFVNYPLTIKDILMSAIFIETRQFIRVSLRSRGDVDVSEFAKRYFDGGGHRNAAGGKSFLPMDQTVSRYKEAVREFLK